jgi:hypothetical protein
MGVTWLGVIHDWSKFLPDEFLPYAIHFYGNRHDINRGRDETGYYKPTDTGDKAFDFAWMLHQKRNRHHWQWWILPQDNGSSVSIEMPECYWKEMICDWRGAGRAQGKPNTVAWYEKNKIRMTLHSLTRDEIEDVLF